MSIECRKVFIGYRVFRAECRENEALRLAVLKRLAQKKFKNELPKRTTNYTDQKAQDAEKSMVKTDKQPNIYAKQQGPKISRDRGGGVFRSDSSNCRGQKQTLIKKPAPKPTKVLKHTFFGQQRKRPRQKTLTEIFEEAKAAKLKKINKL